ncbi:ABC transporter ATP-binding protein [Rhodobacteraceae bacterium CCMM004]|nr:ABC transporter ATP-binding protein [Rhodobacteraceae bacterium CCMM004]
MTADTKISLSIENVEKYYGGYRALSDIDISVVEGEFLVLVGPSGCGKSTLMRCIAGLEKIDAGTLRIGGRDVTSAIPSERGVAMVFQSYALYPHMTVADNIGFPLRIAKRPKAEIKARVAEVGRLLKIEGLLSRRPRELSGGQRQRVAIGRALVHQPQIYLFDEPLSNLDAALRVEMRVELARLHNATGTTMVYVTHDQVEAMTMANRIVVMNGGVIEQIGAPLELFNNPANRFVAGFIGQPTTNFVNGRVVSADAGAITVELPGGKPFPVAVTERLKGPTPTLEVGIRPQFFSLAQDGAADLTITVDVVEQLGDETLIYGELDGDQSITVQVAGQHHVARGARLDLAVDHDKVMLFDDRGLNLCRRPS